MKLGISSYSYGWAVGVGNSKPLCPLSAFDLVKRANELNIKVLQIADNMPLHLMTKSEMGKLNNISKELSVKIEVGTRGLIYDHMMRYLEIASYFDSRILRIVIDDREYTPTVEEVVTIINKLLPALKERSIILAIENHDRFKVSQLVEIIQRTDAQSVGICLDTVNSLGACEGTEFVVNMLAPYTVNLHIKDFSIKRVDHLMGFTVLGAPAGQGDLDIPWLINSINEEHQEINAILEQWTPPEENVEMTIVKEKDWALQSITYLKQYLE